MLLRGVVHGALAPYPVLPAGKLVVPTVAERLLEGRDWLIRDPRGRGLYLVLLLNISEM